MSAKGLLYQGSKDERRDHRLSVQAKSMNATAAVACIGEPWERVPKGKGMPGWRIAKMKEEQAKAREIENLILRIAMLKNPTEGNPHAKGEYAWHEWNREHGIA